MNKKTTIILIIVIIACLVGYKFYDQLLSSKITTTLGEVESYLQTNIGELSPEKPVLGGKFYVTKVTFGEPGVGVVEYEDGHIAFRASFHYVIGPTGLVVVDNFVVIRD